MLSEQRLESAYALSGTAVHAAATFYAYASEEMAQQRDEMKCCSVRFVGANGLLGSGAGNSAQAMLVVVVGGVLILALGVWRLLVSGRNKTHLI